MPLFFFRGSYRKYFWFFPPPGGSVGEFLIEKRDGVTLVTEDMPSEKILEVLFTKGLFGGRKTAVFPDVEDLRGEMGRVVEEIFQKREFLEAHVYITTRYGDREKKKPPWDKFGVEPERISEERARNAAGKYLERVAARENVVIPPLIRQYLEETLPEDPQEFLSQLENMMLLDITRSDIAADRIADAKQEKEILYFLGGGGEIFDLFGDFVVRRKPEALVALVRVVHRLDEGAREHLKFMGGLKWYVSHVRGKARRARERDVLDRLLGFVVEAEIAGKGGSRLPPKDAIRNCLLRMGSVLL